MSIRVVGDICFAPHGGDYRCLAADFPDRWMVVGAALAAEKAGAEPVYETVTDAQNASLKWLVGELTTLLAVPLSEVFRHPQVSRKNMTEASTAKWQ